MMARQQQGDHRGYFGVAVYHPKTETNVGTLWRSATTYGAAFLATVGRRYGRQAGDTRNSPARVPLHHYLTLDELLQHLPYSCPLVGVELTGDAVPLGQFVHPPRALYLLGAEDYGLVPKVLARCHRVVQIPSPVDQSLNVAVAGSIVIVDRYIRSLGRPPSDVLGHDRGLSCLPGAAGMSNH